MLLGVFTTYTELTSRVDRDVRHWQNDFYVQDNWRVTPRLTVDYGLRIQHSGSDFEVNDMNSGFFTDRLESQSSGRACIRLVCMDGRPGNQACPANLQRAIDPANPGVFLPTAFNGNIVQGSGSQINGITTGGIPGRKPGTYFTFPYFVYAPRAGFAWNMFGDGKTALRGSWGIFYNFPRSAPGASTAPVAAIRSPAAARSPCTAADPLGDVQRHHDRDGGEPDREPGQRERRRLRAAAREIAQRQHRVPARYRLQYRCRNRVCRELHRGITVGPSMSTACRCMCFGNPDNLVNNAPLNTNPCRARCTGSTPAWARSRSSFRISIAEVAALQRAAAAGSAPVVQGPADGTGVHARER